MQLLACAVCSIVASVITTRILAARYFQIVDRHVTEMTDMTKAFVEEQMANQERRDGTLAETREAIAEKNCPEQARCHVRESADGSAMSIYWDWGADSVTLK